MIFCSAGLGLGLERRRIFYYFAELNLAVTASWAADGCVDYCWTYYEFSNY